MIKFIQDKLIASLFLSVLLAFVTVSVASAQPMDTRHKVDTLTFGERLSVRTNVADWALMIPNIGVEYDLRNTNWNRYAINVNFRFRPGNHTTFLLPLVYRMKEVKVEGRMYWHERQARPTGYLKRHSTPWDKLMSCRRMVTKHPRTTYYRGVYASYGSYGLRIKDDGHQGTAAQVGVTWGFLRPLYAYRNGNSIDFEIGISGGLAMAKDETFVLDRQLNQYVTKERKDWKFVPFPVVNDLHVALVYRFGKYPVQKKYRWRYDVDMEYQQLKDSLWMRDDRAYMDKLYRDSVYKVVSRDFREMYDSVIAVRRQERQEKIDRKAPARVPKQ